MEVLLCERVNDLCHSLFHLLNCLITTASELRKKAKVIGSKVWTIRRLRNCLDIHLGQIVCDKDGVVDWCIVLLKMPLTSSDGISAWIPLKPQHSNPSHNPFGQSTMVYWLPYSSHTSHHPSQTPCLPWISYATQKLMFDSCKMVEKQSEAFHTFLWHFFQV